jgi:hypothetical protein
MHIEFLIEEPSVKIVLDKLVPQIFLDQEVTFDTHIFNGKFDLLRKLPERLRGYKKWIPEDWRIVVLIDEDRQDCYVLKAELEQAAHQAGFWTPTSVPAGKRFQVLNRIAIEELEAWFFGDIEALRTAYPRLAPTLGQQSKYRNPDAISGGTWEVLERLLKETGDHPGGLEKLRAAEEISPHMRPERNLSKSFQVFRDGLLSLVN